MKTVIVLEANGEVSGELKSALEKKQGYFVSYVGDDGETGLQKAMEIKPDLMIVGMFLKGCDGCKVIREAKKTIPSTKIVATGVQSDALTERAIVSGADYYLIKPFSLASALECVESLLKEERGRETVVQPKRNVTLDEKISDIFISIGIPPHIKGYSYLREGIKTTVKQPYIINNVTKGLYPSIAKTFETTPSKVERAIRHAIEVAWNRGRIDAINAVFGARVYLGAEKPTNSEFIALVADKLILENLV